MSKDLTAWHKSIAKRCLEAAKRPWGVGWSNLDEATKRALVRSQVLDVVVGWAEPERIQVTKVHELAAAVDRIVWGDE